MTAQSATSTPALSPIARALALASRLGARTQAKTLKGIMGALRTVRPTIARPEPARRAPAVRLTSSIDSARAAIDATRWQAGARTDLIGTDDLLDLALAAHLHGDRREIAGRCVPHSYRGRAYASVAWAEARGRVVVLAFARVDAKSAAYGSGQTSPAKAGAPRIAIARAALHGVAIERQAVALAKRLAA